MHTLHANICTSTGVGDHHRLGFASAGTGSVEEEGEAWLEEMMVLLADPDTPEQ